MTKTYTADQARNRISPFRYPGGKASIYVKLRQAIQSLGSDSVTYIEPYAGGAGSALLLLKDNIVDEIHLNDADICVYSAWKAMLNDTNSFIEAIMTTPVTMDTWYKSKEIVSKATPATDTLELGFATFFLNRTNRSGILRGAGPIGGYSQSGTWRLDARYYKSTIVDRIRTLQKMSSRIHLHWKDGLEFLKWSAENLQMRDLFAFVDPPYVQAGNRLYLNTMNEKKHSELAAFLMGQSIKNWVLTYDDCDLIRTLYSSMPKEKLEINYSLQNRRRETEIIITALTDR